MSNNDVFKPEDGSWYFWLGDNLHGPYDEYTRAHEELIKALESAKEEKDK